MESDIKKICFRVTLIATIMTNILCTDVIQELSVPLELSVTWDVESTVVGYASFEVIGVVGCAKICFQKPECQSFTHFKSTLKCEIFDHSLQSNNLSTLKMSIYSEKINWNQDLFSGCSELNCSLGSSCFIKQGTPTCIPTECGPTPLVANSQMTVHGTRVGTLVQYTCNPETVLEGRPERRCLTIGKWQPDLFKCHLQCPPAPLVPDAALDDPLRIVGIYTNYTCVNNTRLFGTPHLYCQDNQTWTPVEFECIRQCPPAPDVNDATTNTSDRIINTTLGYQCHPLADAYGTPFIVCQEDLSWSPVVFNCSRQCPIAEEVTHARKLTHVRQVFTTLEYECINDTLLDGNPTRNCPTTQQWEPIQFTCIEQCPVLDIPHAINDTSNRVLTSAVNYHCEDGYLHNGTTQITCQNDRTWTSINFECIEVCPTEAPPVQYAQTDQILRFVGTVATYTCDPDTIIHGDNYVTCIHSSNSTVAWSTVPFWCEKVCSDSPPVVMDATLTTFNRSKGAVAEYTCHNETVLIDGPATIPCLQSQQWGAQIFDCRRRCPIPLVYPNSIVIHDCYIALYCYRLSNTSGISKQYRHS
ncbi:hypothetical protein LOTGIDRAFT_162341 [Lottia gigantea]|uniref:Sushi domain-containing protein n=1 Tax=Lottia gigantea TaxID=225164 RepID=V4BV31_LOTGI|nr:hypothetical protein LOTGIDRAFT_162341 [Lottia gigantea]ESO92864.1 hypothetical protein LOTGIDRAFT_162341 [Lottia gigantea]